MSSAVEQHYTPAEVAELLRLSRRSVERLLASRALAPVVRVGRAVRVPSSAVVLFLESRRV